MEEQEPLKCRGGKGSRPRKEHLPRESPGTLSSPACSLEHGAQEGIVLTGNRETWEEARARLWRWSFSWEVGHQQGSVHKQEWGGSLQPCLASLPPVPLTITTASSHYGAGSRGWGHPPGFPCPSWGFLGSGCWLVMGKRHWHFDCSSLFFALQGVPGAV